MNVHDSAASYAERWLWSTTSPSTEQIPRSRARSASLLARGAELAGIEIVCGELAQLWS